MEPAISAANIARHFDESTNFVDGQVVAQDDFYTAPSYSPDDKPGKVLKVDDDAQESRYFLPQATAISRIMYLSQTLAGKLVPVTASILWPFSPRTYPDGKFQVVAWAHGTSGFVADYAPSHLRNLWQHFQAPFQLVLQGYVVVATDYAGLGVHSDFDGQRTVHPWLALPAHASDIAYAVEAACSAFAPQLSGEYIAIGHSQGGGSVWAVAQRQADTKTSNRVRCLGCVAVSPVTNALKETSLFRDMLVAGMTTGLKENYPDVNLNEILTPSAIEGLRNVYESKTNVAGTLAILQGAGDILVPGWQNNKTLQEYMDKVSAGSKAVGCPLLVVTGSEDPAVGAEAVKKVVEQTREIFPDARIELVMLLGIGHVPALPAGQRLWMDWIDKRFAREELTPQTIRKIVEIKPPKSMDRFSTAQTWYLAPATEFYHTP